MRYQWGVTCYSVESAATGRYIGHALATTPEASTAIVRTYIAKKGILIESPDLYISHVVKQAQGNPQAIADMLDDSAKSGRATSPSVSGTPRSTSWPTWPPPSS